VAAATETASAPADLGPDHEDPDEDGRRGGDDEGVDPGDAVVLAVASPREREDPDGDGGGSREVGGIRQGWERLDAVGARHQRGDHVAHALERDAGGQHHPGRDTSGPPQPDANDDRPGGRRGCTPCHAWSSTRRPRAQRVR
jgi:hypothetical protein